MSTGGFPVSYYVVYGPLVERAAKPDFPQARELDPVSALDHAILAVAAGERVTIASRLAIGSGCGSS